MPRFLFVIYPAKFSKFPNRPTDRAVSAIYASAFIRHEDRWQ